MTPVLFIPGLLCTAEIFAPQVAALWPYGPVMVASTLRGDTVATIAAAILVDAPPKFALVGISMGGYVCFEILRQAPERVLKLALLDTSARPDTPEQSEGRRALVAQARSGDAAAYEALADQALAAILHPAHRDDPRLRDINVRMARTIGVDGLERQEEAAIARPDSRPNLSAIHVPTLVLVGDSDSLTPPALSEEIARAIPNARLVIIEKSGHGSTVEQPAQVNRALIEWLIND